MMKKRIFGQVLQKGPSFSFVFFLFFMMSFLPIVLLLAGSLAQGNLPGVALALVFAAVLVKDMRDRKLFELCRDMAVLNLTLWFLLGFFSLVQGLSQDVPGYLSYLLLAPYALLSGYLVYYLLSRAEHRRERVLHGGVAVSTMIAVISAINGAVIGALKAVPAHVERVVAGNGTTAMLPTVIPEFHNPHVAFLLVLALFNIPFIVRYTRSGKKHARLLWYALPIGVYLVLTATWHLFKGLLLG